MIREIFTKEIAKLGVKKGRYTLMTWKSESENGEWLKLSRGVVRLWTIEPLQAKAGHYYIRLRVTKNKHQKLRLLTTIGENLLVKKNTMNTTRRKNLLTNGLLKDLKIL